MTERIHVPRRANLIPNSKLSFTSPQFRCSSAALFLLLQALLHGTPASAYPPPGLPTCVHHDTQDNPFLASKRGSMSYPTKTVAKRAVFDLIPHKVRIEKKTKNRNQVRSKYKKLELRDLIRHAFKNYYDNHRRSKDHQRRTTFTTSATNASTVQPLLLT